MLLYGQLRGGSEICLAAGPDDDGPLGTQPFAFVYIAVQHSRSIPKCIPESGSWCMESSAGAMTCFSPGMYLYALQSIHVTPLQRFLSRPTSSLIFQALASSEHPHPPWPSSHSPSQSAGSHGNKVNGQLRRHETHSFPPLASSEPLTQRGASPPPARSRQGCSCQLGLAFGLARLLLDAWVIQDEARRPDADAAQASHALLLLIYSSSSRSRAELDNGDWTWARTSASSELHICAFGASARALLTLFISVLELPPSTTWDAGWSRFALQRGIMTRTLCYSLVGSVSEICLARMVVTRLECSQHRPCAFVFIAIHY
ncbi:hypothetical protein EVG20_g2663 [Dentipellis fragilis]|uniref:Uncharacterized protein n=1 Tax=Dentipellis fragilis TaxID=205917 RepID=A0A4Y9Z949_9AGAM|nr:hypothetical protein EVG20_g2663 [Dentipellis fragilis]